MISDLWGLINKTALLSRLKTYGCSFFVMGHAAYNKEEDQYMRLQFIETMDVILSTRAVPAVAMG